MAKRTANPEAIPSGLVAQVWQIYGFRRGDVSAALLAFLPGFQIFGDIVDRLELSALLPQLLRVWREATRAVWRDVVSVVESTLGVEIHLAAEQLDALTLICLAGGAAISSLLMRRGESLPKLAMRSSDRQYHQGVALLIYPIIGAIFVGTALVFFPHAIGDWSGASLLAHSAVPAIILIFFLWRAWVEQHKWRKVAETLRVKASDGSPDVSDTKQGRRPRLLRSPTELLQKPAPRAPLFTRALEILLPLLPWAVVLMVATYFNVFLETGGSTIVFVIAFATMSVCIWLNWRAFPLIFLNVAALLAINFITIQANDVLRPVVDYLEGIISSGRV